MSRSVPRVGLLLPTREVEMGTGLGLADVVELAVAAEQAGLDSVWVGDSPLARPRAEPFSLLGAVAARTTTVGLGTAALLPALRPPLHTAHAAATLDQLAPGRVTLGVGAGFPLDATRDEFAALGVPFAGRARRLDHIVALWRALWWGDGEAAARRARALGIEATAATLAALPRPATPGGPDVWLAAGASPGVTVRVAWHYDGWLPYVPTPAAYATGAAAVLAERTQLAGSHSQLPEPEPDPVGAAPKSPPTPPVGSRVPAADSHADGAGSIVAVPTSPLAPPAGAATPAGRSSPPPSAPSGPSRVPLDDELAKGPALGLYVTLTLADDAAPEAVSRARDTHEAYLQAYYGVGADVIGSLQACHVGDPASAVDFLGRYVAAGARHLVVRIGAPAPEHAHQLRLLAHEVAPAVRALGKVGVG